MYYRVIKQCNYLDIQLNPGMTFAFGDLAADMVSPLLKSNSIELFDETKKDELATASNDKNPA
jgi:hypothetical protein